MSEESLEVSLQGQASTITIVLRGDLMSANGDAVSLAYREATAKGARSIVVDFDLVDLLGDEVASQSYHILREARKANQRLVFTSLPPHYQKFLTMVGLARYIKFCDNIAEAYRYLESEA